MDTMHTKAMHTAAVDVTALVSNATPDDADMLELLALCLSCANLQGAVAYLRVMDSAVRDMVAEYMPAFVLNAAGIKMI